MATSNLKKDYKEEKLNITNKSKKIEHAKVSKAKAGRPKLTAAQKNKNKAQNKQIKKAYNKIENNPEGLTYKQFKNRVLTNKQTEITKQPKKKGGKKITTKQAINKVLNSTTFKTAAERGTENFLNGIKVKFPEEYKQIRNHCRDEKGRLASPKNNLVEFDRESKQFIFINKNTGRLLGVSLENSPEALILTYLN